MLGFNILFTRHFNLLCNFGQIQWQIGSYMSASSESWSFTMKNSEIVNADVRYSKKAWRGS